MKAFVFPLARVLDLRRKQVQIEELKLERLLTECRRIEAEIACLHRAAEESAKSLLGRRVLDAIELQALGQFRFWTAEQCGLMGKRLEEVERGAAEQQVRLNH